jgi:hypothetical protein
MAYVSAPPEGDTVTFRLDPGLKAKLTRLAEQDHKSLGEFLRELAGERVERERRRVFEAEARRQSLLIGAQADDPNSDEAEVMRWISGAAWSVPHPGDRGDSQNNRRSSRPRRSRLEKQQLTRRIGDRCLGWHQITTCSARSMSCRVLHARWLLRSPTGGSRGAGRPQPVGNVRPGPAPLRRLVISLSHGAEWKALISKYIGAIPVNGDALCAAEHNIPDIPLSWVPVSSAMIAKAGAAARDSKQSALA